MRVLTLDSALAHVSAGLVENGSVLTESAAMIEHGKAGRLAVFVRDLLTHPGWGQGERCVAVTLGPGSFTGVRAALALAHGLGLGAGVPVIGVTVGEALEAVRGAATDRQRWTAIDNRRGRVFLEIAGIAAAFEVGRLPVPAGPVEVLGDAAEAVAARLNETGADAITGEARWPTSAGIANAALARLRGGLPPRSLQPVYVDQPEAKLPRGGLRPAPVA